MHDSEMSQEVLSDCPDEKAVFVPGQGTKILNSNREQLRNMDEVIQEKCQIKKPVYSSRARSLCHEFNYFEQDLEVFTDEEGLHKAINGYILGEHNHVHKHFKKLRRNKRAALGLPDESSEDDMKKPVISEPAKKDEENAVPKPSLVAPEARLRGNIRVIEIPFVNRPDDALYKDIYVRSECKAWAGYVNEYAEPEYNEQGEQIHTYVHTFQG